MYEKNDVQIIHDIVKGIKFGINSAFAVVEIHLVNHFFTARSGVLALIF